MANTGYQLEGNAPQQYERDNVSTLGRPMAEQMFEHVSLHDGDRVLDVACGTGIVTRVAAQRFPNIASIVGVDLNTGMLEVARHNTPTASVPVIWQQGDLCALPFPDGSFDVALCQQGLQYIRDKLAALGEIRRVLAPGGRLAFTVWSEVPSYHAALADALRHHVNHEAATSCLAPFAWCDAKTIRKAVEDAGFCAIEMQALEIIQRMASSAESVLKFIARHSYARDVEAMGGEARRAIGQQVVDALQASVEGDDFVIPRKIHLVQAQA